MEGIDYRSLAKGFGAKKSFGQNFLVSTEIAALEAQYGKELDVIELGSGLGILTKELCKTARKVISIEKDTKLFDYLSSEIKSKKLVLVCGDFFSVDVVALGNVDIMISNIPYNLSSKTIYWLGANHIPAVLCLQKEFADHIFAIPGSKSYSKLSVVSSLSLKSYKIKEVAAGNFYPKPRVDSTIIYLAPKPNSLDMHLISIISSVMNHKKKRLHNAIIDCAKDLGMEKTAAKEIADKFEDSPKRPFQMKPEELLVIAQRLSSMLDLSK